MKIKALTLALCCLALSGAAQPAVVSGTAAGDRSVRASVVADGIVRVVNTPLGQSAPQLQVVMPLSDSTHNDGSVTVSIDAQGVLTITDNANGTVLIDSGIRHIQPDRYSFTLSALCSGSYYGGGERGHSTNLRGDTLVNYNRQNYGYTGSDPRISQMNITMPLLLNSNGFAIIFDDFAASTMIPGDSIVYTTEAPVPVTYYYVGGVRTLADLTERLTSLTGRQPLPPLWAMGYINSKYGYKSPQETIAAVDSLKSLGYPLDGTVLDLYWFGKEQDMGYLDWDSSVWPQPAQMMDSLRARGVNLITVSEPYILTNGRGVDNYNILSADSMLVRTTAGDTHPVTIWVGEGGMFDVSNPRTRSWLRQRYKMLTDLGIGGWWGDLGEPEVHPETGHHANGLTARQYHNRYGNDWSSIISEMYATEYPQKRLMTLMRGGTIGLQRHSVFPWSTDVSRSWGGLEPQVRIMLNSGLSGLGYMSSDLGGFAVDEASPYMPELYLRWLQMGLFSPVFRTHAQQYAEPFNYPMYAAELLDIVKQRYRWLPYNYTLAYENAAKGWPLVRPLDFHSGGNGSFDSVHNSQYLWGRNVMVAPVLEEGARERSVVFPGDSDWYSADGKTLYSGGTTETVAAPLDTIPLFFRAGAVVPSADYPMENTGCYRADHFKITYYPGKESQYTMYDDNRMSPMALADGSYRLLHFDSVTDGDTTEIRISSNGSYDGAPDTIRLDFELMHAAAPATVTVDGIPVDAVYNQAGQCVSFSIRFDPSSLVIVKATTHR